MAHFAKLGVGNIVEKVEVVSNDIATTEQAGIDFLKSLYGEDTIWKQTSYNTYGGQYYTVNENGDRVVSSDQSKAFRKNYAGVGYKYDQTRDAFIAGKHYSSWILDNDTCLWKAPVDKPTDGQAYQWNETTRSWDLLEE